MVSGTHLRKIFIGLFFFSLSFFTKIEASHLMGADITYECLDHSNEIYRLHFKLYRDCNGITPGTPNFNFCPITGSGCPQPIMLNTLTNTPNVHLIEVTPICPGVTTPCSGSGSTLSFGVQEYYWTQDIQFVAGGSGCTVYKIKYTEGVRNPVGNLTSSPNLTIFSTEIHRDLAICNNSPTFNNIPTPYFCSDLASSTYFYSQGATDIDGDSLVYRIGECYGAPNGACGNPSVVPYNIGSGYTALQPFGNQYDMIIDPNTGDLAINKTGGGSLVAVACIYVDEYRNGVLIGSIVRDMQFTFYQCGTQNPNPPVVDTVTIGNGGSGEVLSFQKEYCLGDTIDLNFCFTDADGDNIGVSWDGGIPGASFTNVPPLTTTPCAPFHWDPSSFTYGPGTYSFLVTAEDDGCPTHQKFQRTMQITIYDTAISLNPQITTLGCNHKQFDVNLISGVPPYDFTWYIDGVFASDSAVFDSIFPGPGTHTYSIVTNAGTGCQSTDTGSFTVIGITAFAGNDTSICSGESIPLGAVGTAGVDYLWSPTTAVSDSAISNPMSVVFTNTGTAPYDTVLYLTAADTGAMGSGCLIVDSIVITVLPNPTISISALPGTNVCPGTNVTLTGSGTPVGSTYIWSTGDTATSIALNSLSVDTTIIAQAMVGACLGDFDTITITMNPVPTATITNVALGDTFVCPGSSITINATSDIPGSTFQWSTGDVGSSINITPTTTDTMIVVTPTSPLTCAGTPDTVYIHHYPTVTSDFTADTVCLGLPTTFTDASTYSGVGGYTVEYDYGSGFTSANTFTFGASGVHSVTMRTVTNTGTCTTTVTKNIFVNPLPIPLIEGLANGSTTICENDSVTLHASGGQTYTWTWAIGTSTGDSITVSPSSTTIYTLTTADSNTCANAPANNASFTVNVNLRPIVAFINPPASACDGSDVPLQVNVTNGVTGGSFIWSFTGNTSSSETLTNLTSDTEVWVVPVGPAPTFCVGDTVKHTIVMDSLPNASFVTDTACPSFPTTFTSTSTVGGSSVSSVEWDFDNDAIFDATGTTVSNVMASSGLPVTIRVISAAGCTTMVTQNVPLHTSPTAAITPANSSDCVYNAANFSGTGSTATGTLVDYSWDFGDASTGNGLNVSHQYAAAGSYTVQLIVTDDNGCKDTTTTTYTVQPKPIADFNYTNVVCDGTPVTFTDASTGGTINSWQWDFDSDATIDATTQNPTFTYPGIGTYTITLIVGNTPGGCLDTITKTIDVQPIPVSSFTTSDVCDGSVVTFTNTTGTGTASWNFGDGGTSNSQAGTVTHTYNNPGTFNVTLTTTLGSCVDTVIHPVIVHPVPVADFNPSATAICVNGTMVFTDASTISSGSIDSWQWNFGDGSTSSLQSPTHAYTSSGTYTVKLVVTSGPLGCADSITKTISVQDAPAAPTVLGDTICEGESASLIASGGSIYLWYSNATSTTPINNGSVFITSEIFNNTIFYVESVSSAGCTSPRTPVSVIVNKVDIDFYADSTELNIPEATTQFHSVSSSNITSYSWDFGDGGTSGDANPIHTYDNDGKYTVKLTVVDEFGCEKTITKTDYISVEEYLNLWIPNAFSPNGDGLNETFFIKGRLISTASIWIYDRWGGKVFEAIDNIDFEWNGKDMQNNDLPEGVYAYRIKYTIYSGETKEIKGTVTIIK